jgi:DNA invertase Pin-like site-specific DNA recombinase
MFRYAVLSGVSSDIQAEEDKGSLDDQIQTARRAGEQQGGRETAGPFVLDGYSRTGYVNLSDALRDIPPLQAALEAAERDLYDVLILDNLERLGDLAPMIATLFKRYKKQIHSARQPSRIFDPNDYDPFSDESADIMIHVEGIIQRYRQNKLRRGLALGIRKRVEEGRYSTSHPYGYRKGSNKGDDLQLEPTVANLLIQLKDEFLRGAPLRTLVQIAQASGVPGPRGPRWHGYTVKRILVNPFYAGKVFHGRWKMISHKRSTKTGKHSSIMKLNTDIRQVHDGNHEPLWTWEEHLRMIQEMEERYKRYPRHDPYNFSGLMQCTVCGKRVSFRGRKYRCNTSPDHIALKVADADRLIAEALADALRNYREEPEESPGRAVRNPTQESIADLEKRIAMIQHHMETESGMYTAKEAIEKIQSLRAQIQKTEGQRQDQKHQEAVRRRRDAQRAELLPKLDRLSWQFTHEDPAVNNRMLRDILTTIYVTPGHTFEFEFR